MQKKTTKTRELEVIIPYSAEGSKNRKFRYRSSKILTEGYKAFRDTVVVEVRNKCRLQNITFVPAKLYVRFTLYRTGRQSRTDAHNFIEALCDGIQEAVGVNDKWFAGSWDWEDADEAYIKLVISQGH